MGFNSGFKGLSSLVPVTYPLSLSTPSHRYTLCRAHTCVTVLLVVVGPVRTDHDQQHCYHHVPTVNQRLLLLLLRGFDNGHKDARNMLSGT